MLAMLCLPAFFSGCQDPPPPYPKFVATIHYGDKHLPGTFANAKQGVQMPVTGRLFEILALPTVGIENFGTVELVEAGPPNERRPCLQVRLFPADANKIFSHTLNARESYLFLIVNGIPVGIHQIQGPITNGNIPFLVELPHKEQEDLVNQMHELALDLRDSIVMARKYAEYIKQNQ